MAQIKVVFNRCIQDSQEYGSNDEHMISRVFFTISVDGEQRADTYADIKQTVGDSYETGAVEVGHPANYSGPFHHQEFARQVEGYFRRLVGAQGRVIRIAPGARNITMQGNTYVVPHEVTFEADTSSPDW